MATLKQAMIKIMTRQNQEGGDSSTNIQAQQIVLNVGIDEKRAREIYHEMNLQLRKDYSQEALNVADSRISEFENSLMSKMERIDGALEAFTDPSFQLLLVEAQKTAASTERPADYELLSELLIHRFLKGQDRTIRAGINRAVEIVDEISNDGLLGLTVSHAISYFYPLSGGVNFGLDVLNDLFGKILYSPLPKDIEWLDHVEILDAIRLKPLQSLNKIESIYSERLSGYLDVGIKKESENHIKAIELLKLNRLPLDLLEEHPLNQDYVRMLVVNRKEISSIILTELVPTKDSVVQISKKPNDEQIKALQLIYDLYVQDHNLRNINVSYFMSEWNKRDNLKMISDWWSNIPTAFQITSVGRVLAHSNAQRCDNKLPPLN